MKREFNHLNQSIGYRIPDWKSPSHPQRKVMTGRYCRLEPLEVDIHAKSLWSANAMDTEGKSWTYLPYGPFDSFNSYQSWLTEECLRNDPMFFAIIDPKRNAAVGVASYLRIQPKLGSIEVGHLHFSNHLQRTPASTEAMYLMMANVFELGYRRYEWKCNDQNMPSRLAAQRLGFSFEGIFRQAGIVKGHNRDTAWFAAMDHEWPAICTAMQTWLNPTNFDDDGNQKSSLSSLTAPLLHYGIAELE